MYAVGEALGLRRYVDEVVRTVPPDVVSPESRSADRRIGFPECNHHTNETQHVAINLCLCPVEPTGFVILVVGVTVSLLGVEKLIAHAGHRRASGQHTWKALAELNDARRIPWLGDQSNFRQVVLRTDLTNDRCCCRFP